MLRVLSCACILAVIAITPITLRSFAEGPFPGFTGGFGEPTCQQCHFGNDLNAPGGMLTLSGLPPSYEPGKSYALTVSLAKDGLEKGGFQLSARAASGATRGRDAGSFIVQGSDLQLVKGEDKKTTYLQHTPAGTRTKTRGTLTWKFRWTAPNTAVPVQFDLAANASNNDESPMDDAIYSRSATVKPAHKALGTRH